jgi:hypothetical protein
MRSQGGAAETAPAIEALLVSVLAEPFNPFPNSGITPSRCIYKWCWFAIAPPSDLHQAFISKELSILYGYCQAQTDKGMTPHEGRLPFDTMRNFDGLARIIHEHYCCNRRSAATTSLRPAGSPLGPSPYCTSTHRVLTAPRAGLATRLSGFATNRHE